MAQYTICPQFIEFAGKNPKYIYDVLMVFVPDNSKVICIDEEEKLLKVYDHQIKNNKDLLDWFRFLSMNKEINITKVQIGNTISNLPLSVCEKSFDRLLITADASDYSTYRNRILDNGVEVLDKNLAKVRLNYGDQGFPKTMKSNFTAVTRENVFDVVKEICISFKEVIENNGLFKLLVSKNGSRVSEDKAQLLFYGVAISHCRSNDLKLSPEVDSGNGPVDFNISKGYKANVNVEMKFADNPKLNKGLWTQLAIYNQAENTDKSIYLIIKTSLDFDLKISQLQRVLEYRKSKGEKLPDIFIVDSTYKESASIR